MAEGGDKLALNAIRHLIDRVDGAVAKRQEFQARGPVKLVHLVDEETRMMTTRRT